MDFIGLMKVGELRYKIMIKHKVTNFKRIKQMSVDELRDFIFSITYDCKNSCLGCNIDCNENVCKARIKEYLLSEVKDEIKKCISEAKVISVFDLKNKLF